MRDSPWIIGATIIGSLAVGLAIGVMAGESGPSDHSDGRTTARSAGEDRALNELIVELRAIREALVTQRAAPARAVEPGESPGTAGLESWFTQLDERLAALASAATAGGEGALARPVRFPHERFEPTPFPMLDEVSTRDFSKRHLFWSFQQVVDAYGPPRR